MSSRSHYCSIPAFPAPGSGCQTNPLQRSRTSTLIHRLKTLEVVIKAGWAERRYPAVKSSGPDDLVFQSVKDGSPMRDNNVLSKHIKPAARALGFSWVNWQVLRRSCATWLQQAGVDVKDAQGLLRHSRASTTQDIYQQIVAESQHRAVRKLTTFVQQGRSVQ